MILEVSDTASVLVRGTAVVLLTLHIAGGAVGIATGAAALVIRKGGRRHRMVGNIFFISMLIMASIGAAVSPFLTTPQWPNVVAGTFTCYLVTTSWMTVRRREGSAGRFEAVAFVAALCVAVGGILIAIFDPNTRNAGPAYLFSGLAFIAAIGDYRLLRRGGISGAPRIARHLWRMTLALLIATGSFFLGQAQLFPETVRGTGLLFVPVLLVIGSLIFWLVRVRFTNRFKRTATPA